MFTAFNDFLAKQFGSEDAAFASAPSQGTDNAEKPPETEEKSPTEESQASVPDVGPDLDETDLDGGEDQPIPADLEEDEQKSEQHMDTQTESEEAAEETEDEESPYINGVRVLEVEDEEEDEENDEQEESPPEEETAEVDEDEDEKDAESSSTEEMTQESTEEKETETPTNVVDEDSGDDQAEKDDEPSEDFAEEEESSEEKSAQAAAEETDSQEADTPKTEPSFQDDIVEPGSQPSEQDVVQQNIDEDEGEEREEGQAFEQEGKEDVLAVNNQETEDTAGAEEEAGPAAEKEEKEDVLAAGKEEKENMVTADRKADGDATADSQDTVKVHTMSEGSPDQSADTEPVKDGEEDSGLVDSTASLGGDVEQQTEESKLLFQPGDTADRKEGEIPAVEHMDTLDSLSTSEDTLAKEESHAESGQAGQEAEGEQEGIQPDHTQSEPATAPPHVHQPVDIDFVAGQVQDSQVTLESSQDTVEQQLPTETPTLQESTPILSHTDVPVSTGAAPSAPSGEEEQTLTTEIDGTRFYLEDGEIADIVPESVPVKEATEPATATQEVEMSPPPTQATVGGENIQPTAATVIPEMSAQQGFVTTPPPFTASPADLDQQAPEQVNNGTGGLAKDSFAQQPVPPKLDNQLQQNIDGEGYQTTADFLNRKVLSVNSQVPPKVENSGQAPPEKKGIELTAQQQASTKGPEESAAEADSSASEAASVPETPTPQIQPSVPAHTASATVTIEGEGKDMYYEFVEGGNVNRADTENMDEVEVEDRSAKREEEEEINRMLSGEMFAQRQAAESATPPPRPPPQQDRLDKEATTQPPSSESPWDGVPPPSADGTTTSYPADQVIFFFW